MREAAPLETAIVALPESAGSALYGLVDVLSATGSVWQSLMRQPDSAAPFRVRIVSTTRERFHCGYGIPVEPHAAIEDVGHVDLVILPELWLGPDEHMRGRYPEVTEWIRARYEAGAHVYSACSGAVMLAETGLLDGRDATSHWAYEELFRREYPQVRFHPAPSLCFADADSRLVTAGGTTSWHDLVLHIIARHVSPAEAMRIAEVYLLKRHDEGQRPYTPLARQAPHQDGVVRGCEDWLKAHHREPGAVAAVVGHAGIPERTLKRRFKAATGVAIIDYVQNLRIDEAKRLLETTDDAADEIGYAVGYEDASFFRRLFKRRTGVTPGRYRRMFQPIRHALAPATVRGSARPGTLSERRVTARSIGRS